MSEKKVVENKTNSPWKSKELIENICRFTHCLGLPPYTHCTV